MSQKTCKLCGRKLGEHCEDELWEEGVCGVCGYNFEHADDEDEDEDEFDLD